MILIENKIEWIAATTIVYTGENFSHYQPETNSLRIMKKNMSTSDVIAVLASIKKNS